ncbi:hypothetical protein ACIA8I_32015 [Streptomyces rishiriensis]
MPAASGEERDVRGGLNFFVNSDAAQLARLVDAGALHVDIADGCCP